MRKEQDESQLRLRIAELDKWLTALVFFGLEFANCIIIKTFQTLLEVKADINRVILTSCSTY